MKKEIMVVLCLVVASSIVLAGCMGASSDASDKKALDGSVNIQYSVSMSERAGDDFLRFTFYEVGIYQIEIFYDSNGDRNRNERYMEEINASSISHQWTFGRYIIWNPSITLDKENNTDVVEFKTIIYT